MTTAERITANQGAGADALRWRQRALEGLATGRPLAEVLDLLARAQQAVCSSDTSCAFVVHDTLFGGARLIAAPSLPDSLLHISRADASGVAPGSAFDIDAAVEPLQGPALSHGLALARTHALTDSDGTTAGVLLLLREVDADPAPFAEDELAETARLAALAITQSDRRRRLEHQARHFEDGQRLARLGTIAFDVRADVWTVSRAWADHIGLDDTVLSREAARNIIHPDDLAMSLDMFQALFSEQGRLEYEHRLIHRRTGAVIFVKIFAGLVRDRRGEPLRVSGVVQDITEQRRAMAALEAGEARLRETTDLLEAGQRMGRMGSFEYHLDDDRWTLSDAWLDLFGADAGSVTTDELIQLVHPDDRADLMKAFEAVRRGEAKQLDHRGIHCGTGAVVHVRSRYDLVRDGSGRPLKIRGLTQDVSEEKQREQALTNKLRQLDLAETIAGMGSWTLDPADGIVQWSDNVYRIYDRDPALGPPTVGDYERFYQGGALETLRAALLGAVRDGRPYDITIPLLFPDGRVKWLHALGQPDPDPGPHGHVVHGTLQDITERKRAETFREDVDRVIRHDLRSPVAATMSGVQLLRLSGDLSPRHQETLDMMERANQRQLTLLDTSMTLYRMEAGTYDLTTEPVDLLAVLEEVRAELTHLAVARHAAVRMDTPEPASVPPTRGDAWLCRAILSNLIRNALEAVPAGMTDAAVTVRLVAEDGRAVITIANPGAVPEDIRPQFFEKYVTSGKSGGTGLGTYSARIMAEAQGGSVALDSTRPDWTTVTVTLPLA